MDCGINGILYFHLPQEIGSKVGQHTNMWSPVVSTIQILTPKQILIFQTCKTILTRKLASQVSPRLLQIVIIVINIQVIEWILGSRRFDAVEIRFIMDVGPLTKLICLFERII